MAEPRAFAGPKDVAARLGVPVSWVYAAAERGTLPSFKIGKYRRFDWREIEVWLETQRPRPGSTLRAVRPAAS